MTNRLCKILKYIYRHPKSNRKTLLKKFTDFDSFSLHPYVIVENQVEFDESQKRTELILKAEKLKLNVSETSEYLRANMLDFKDDDALIFYSTTDKFQEFYEERKRKFRSVWVTFFITTLIAVISLIAQFFGC